MDRLDRQSRIIEYLKIKPIHHGQLETCLLAIPEGADQGLASERLAEIRASLTDQGTNLISLMVRRSNAYGEDFEYEVIYGEEWCLVARELGIERLWVWMFDLDDQQAQVARAEMARLAGGDVIISPESPKPSPSLDADPSIHQPINQQIQQLAKRFEQLETSIQNLQRGPEPTVTAGPQLGELEGRFNQLEQMIQGLGDRGANPPAITKVDSQPLAEVLNRALDAIAAGQIRVNLSIESGKVTMPPPPPPKEPSTVPELRAALQARGIPLPKGAKKPELLALWEQNKS